MVIAATNIIEQQMVVVQPNRRQLVFFAGVAEALILPTSPQPRRELVEIRLLGNWGTVFDGVGTAGLAAIADNQGRGAVPAVWQVLDARLTFGQGFDPVVSANVEVVWPAALLRLSYTATLIAEGYEPPPPLEQPLQQG